MNKLLKITIAFVAGILAVGCYNDFDNPGPAKVYTDADFRPEQLISIKQLKDMFYAKYPGNSGIGQSLLIEDDYVIRGKVISSDRAGNVYKSLYIYDEQSETAIELRLTSGNYVNYPPGRMVYVKLKDLVLGNYRSMISVGTMSADPSYANGNIEAAYLLKEHILKGDILPMEVSDTLVVNASNYQNLTDESLGRLVRFEGIDSKFGSAINWSYGNSFPNYFANSNSYDVHSPDEPALDGKVWSWKDYIEKTPTWALSRWTTNAEGRLSKVYYYGSFWFTYGVVDKLPGNYIIRSSGYSRFALKEGPMDGDVVDITAIYTKFSPDGGEYRTAYQLLLNSDDDVTYISKVPRPEPEPEPEE